MNLDRNGQADAAETQVYEGRGVYVPDGMTAREIVEGARVLERSFGVPPYISRMMVREVLVAMRQAKDAS